MLATITSKGQITLPKMLRDQLHLSAGDRIEFVIEENNVVRLLPHLASVKNLKGMLPKPAQAVSLEQMDQAIADGMGEK